MKNNRIKVSIEEIRVPTLALPTVCVFLVAILIWLLSTRRALDDARVLWPHTLLNSLCVFWLFTPMHDAAHRSISPKHYRWLNESIGHVCAVFFRAPFSLFRYVHLQHHKHTNDPEKDPDFYSGEGHAAFRPFRWLTQDFGYYHYTFLHFAKFKSSLKLSFLVELLIIFSIQICFGKYFGFFNWLMLIELVRNFLRPKKINFWFSFAAE